MPIDELDKKFKDLSDSIERRFEEIHRNIEESLSTVKSVKKDHGTPHQKSRETPFWGIALVIVGVVLLGNHLNWFDIDIPFLPTALIILGCYLIIENIQKH